LDKRIETGLGRDPLPIRIAADLYLCVPAAKFKDGHTL
jgi:hypothetical protein